MLTPAGSKCRIVRRNAGAMREGIARPFATLAAVQRNVR